MLKKVILILVIFSLYDSVLAGKQFVPLKVVSLRTMKVMQTHRHITIRKNPSLHPSGNSE